LQILDSVVEILRDIFQKCTLDDVFGDKYVCMGLVLWVFKRFLYKGGCWFFTQFVNIISETIARFMLFIGQFFDVYRTF
jgi:hypothetical protein